MSIEYTKEVESNNLNNSTALQIIIKQNDTIIRLLKEFIENHKNDQIEVVNETRHSIIDKNKRK